MSLLLERRHLGAETPYSRRLSRRKRRRPEAPRAMDVGAALTCARTVVVGRCGRCGPPFDGPQTARRQCVAKGFADVLGCEGS
jgi:hypothetical protein